MSKFAENTWKMLKNVLFSKSFQSNINPRRAIFDFLDKNDLSPSVGVLKGNKLTKK